MHRILIIVHRNLRVVMQPIGINASTLIIWIRSPVRVLLHLRPVLLHDDLIQILETALAPADAGGVTAAAAEHEAAAILAIVADRG